MLIELSPEELEIISFWYNSAAGESASGMSVTPISQWRKEYLHEYPAHVEEAKRAQALIEKLGFTMNPQDAYCMKRAGLL